MLLRMRIDKTSQPGVWVSKRYCNLSCIWCHLDYFKHDGFLSIGNLDFIQAVKKIVNTTSANKVHVRIAGAGEPTIIGKDELSELVSLLYEIPQVKKVKITTNGILLGECAEELKRSNIDSVTVSINSLNEQIFEHYSGKNSLAKVLSSLEIAHKAGINLSINTIYWKLNSDDILDFEKLSIQYGGLRIKFFDLLPNSNFGKKYYLPLTNLEEKLLISGAKVTECQNPYPHRIYELPSGAVFDVKIAGQVNNCPNMNCLYRDICNEGCRHSIRIGLDGFMRPCGVRSDNIVNLFSDFTTDTNIWNALYSGGKIGYTGM